MNDLEVIPAHLASLNILCLVLRVAHSGKLFIGLLSTVPDAHTHVSLHRPFLRMDYNDNAMFGNIAHTSVPLFSSKIGYMLAYLLTMYVFVVATADVLSKCVIIELNL